MMKISAFEMKQTRVKEILRGMVNDGVLSAVGEKKQLRYVKKQQVFP